MSRCTTCDRLAAWILMSYKAQMRLFGYFLFLVLASAGVASAQADETRDLARAMRVLVSVETPRGPVPIRHCRNAGPDRIRGAIPARVAASRHPVEARRREILLTDRHGQWWARCDARLAAFAGYFVRSAQVYDVDPWILASMARQESGLNPYATGPIGEGGIAQLHPRGVGARSRFVQSESFRRACMRQTDACQEEVIDIQAEHLRFWLDRCDGNIKSALGGYNRGRCGITAYTSNVLGHHRRLLLARPERNDRAHNG